MLLLKRDRQAAFESEHIKEIHKRNYFMYDSWNHKFLHIKYSTLMFTKTTSCGLLSTIDAFGIKYMIK